MLESRCFLEAPTPLNPAGVSAWSARRFDIPKWTALDVIIDKRRVDDMVLLSVEGIIKLGQSAEFLVQSLERTLERDEGHVLLDLSKINYIDSTGIGELVGYLSRFAERDRKLILVSPSDRICKLLKVAQIDQLFPTYPDLEAALEAEGSDAG